MAAGGGTMYVQSPRWKFRITETLLQMKLIWEKLTKIYDRHNDDHHYNHHYNGVMNSPYDSVSRIVYFSSIWQEISS